MKILYTILFFNFFIYTFGYSQNTISGIITADNKPISDATVIISQTGKSKTDWEGKTDADGHFNIPISTTLPGMFSFIIIKKGYISDPVVTYAIKDKIVPISINYGNSVPLNRVEKAIVAGKDAMDDIDGRNKQKYSDKSQKELIELSDSLKSAYDKISNLRSKILNNEITIENANSESKNLSFQIENLIRRLQQLEIENDNNKRKVSVAYMDVVDCFCSGFSSKKLELFFNVVDENHQFITNFQKETFKVVVKKIESLRNNTTGREIPIIYNVTGESFLEQKVDFPISQIKVVFTTDESEFFDDKTLLGLGRGRNYKVYIYNKEFNKVLNGEGLELTDLSRDCFARELKELKNIVRGRSVQLGKRLEVNSDKIKILIYDDIALDGDVISLYLNGSPVLQGYETTRIPKTIELNLNRDTPNELLLFAENLGRIPPNTVKIKIIDSLTEYSEIKLSSDKEKSEALRIVVKKSGSIGYK